MIFKPYWTPRYAIDKIRYLWFTRTHPDLPWITPAAIKILKQNLRADQTGLEIGSGRSTLWMAKRIKHLISLEHDPAYYSKVKEELGRLGMQNVSLILKPPNDARPEESGYISFLQELEGGFDFIFIDGIYRDLAVKIVLDKLHSGGILLLDDCQRFLPSTSRAPYALTMGMKPLNPIWEAFDAATTGWKKNWTCDGMRDTCIYFKP